MPAENTPSAIGESERGDDEFERMTKLSQAVVKEAKRRRERDSGYAMQETTADVYLAQAFLKFARSQSAPRDAVAGPTISCKHGVVGYCPCCALVDPGEESLKLVASSTALRDIDETTALRLAAISTASIQNTREAAKERISRGHPYWTVAYGDVCVAVDREMDQRERAEKAEAALSARGELTDKQEPCHYGGTCSEAYCVKYGCERKKRSTDRTTETK